MIENEYPDWIKKKYEKFITIFSGIYDRNIDEWNEGFMADENPERELAIWDYMANVLEYYMNKYPSSDKKNVFKIILLCSMYDDKNVFLEYNKDEILFEEVKEIVKIYRNFGK